MNTYTVKCTDGKNSYTLELKADRCSIAAGALQFFVKTDVVAQFPEGNWLHFHLNGVVVAS